MQTLSGNTADMDDALPGGQKLKFSSTVYDATLTAEFNFFAYGIGQPFRRLKRWTPYLSAGIGAAMSRSGSDTSGAFVLPLGLGPDIRFRHVSTLWLSLP